MDKIIPSDVESERGGECEVGRLYGVEVKCEDSGRISNDCFEVNGIDKRLSESRLL